MTARIFQPARSAMQSGEAKDNWLLEYEPEKPREIEPLMGWTSSSDMRSQVKLKFDSKEEAMSRSGSRPRSYPIPTISRRTVSSPGRTEALRGAGRLIDSAP
jgi:hypothetical protein